MGWIGKKIPRVFGLLAFFLFIMDSGVKAESVNPHAMRTESYAERCRICHLNDPHEVKTEGSFSDRLSEVCLSCHQKAPLSCRMATTKDVTKVLLEQIPNLVLSTRNGSLTCDSCHVVHSKGGGRVKQTYPLFFKQAERINPHRSGIFCIICHDKEPDNPDAPLNLKHGGDRVLICTQCHNNERARADNHPVNISPSEGKGIKLDERFPLYNGKVTCLTCHDIRCLEMGKNPKFLRGGPYEKRVDACLVCHQKESYKAVNPHEQIDEDGRLRKDRCLYCHIIDIRPSSKK